LHRPVGYRFVRWNWKTAFLPISGFLILLGAVVHRYRDHPYVVGYVSLAFRETLGRLVSDGQRVAAILTAVSVMIVMESAIMFLPTFLKVSKGTTPTMAARAFGLFFVVGLVLDPVAGWLGDLVGTRPIAIASITLTAAGLTVLVVGDGLMLLVGILALGGGIGGFWPAFNALLMTVLSSGGRDSEYGAAKTIWIAVGSVGPGIVGFVGGSYGYDAAFGLLDVIAGLAIGTLLVGARGRA